MLLDQKTFHSNEKFSNFKKQVKDCFISKLNLTNYRNYKYYGNEFPNGAIVILGNNGIGKTNILEAISMMQPGRGIRSVPLKEMVNNKSDSFGINIKFKKDFDEHILGTSYNKHIDKVRKVKMDGDLISPLTLTKFLGIISLTPLMDKIFIESPGSRRKFIDKITWMYVSQHASNVRKYEKLMRERNILLKDQVIDNKWFKNLEEQIVNFGLQIAIDRNKVFSLLREEIQNTSGHFPKASISIRGELEKNFSKYNNFDSLKENYLKYLFDSRKIDYFKGGTGYGPHRSDLEVVYDHKNLFAQQCSTGEQKSLLISIILSICKTFKTHTCFSPILLLDEVFAHLDINKKRALSLEIENLKIQVFMTGLEESDFMTFNKKSYIINLNHK